ncbi:Pr6Pr family membrane protein [Pseudoroseicyclus sp. CXY001]|uniref:Pr6Pr family membrane protein n=1 Tax=Pseudoroseicyclus sp. CXY001 TaxID=3242492 RepID=UPI003570E915
MTRPARLAAALVALLFLAVEAVDIVPAVAAEGLAALASRARYFSDLTIWLVLFGFCRIALTGRAPGRVWAAGMVLWLGIVGVVFFTILGGGSATGFDKAVSYAQHAALPVATALWWLAFAPKAGLPWSAAARWLIWLAAYAVVTIALGFATGWWPYGFLNMPELGWGESIRNLIGFFGAFWLAGLALVALARALGRYERPSSSSRVRP